MANPAAVTSKKNCHCYHCKKDGFSRRDLDEHFLCAECRKLPDVRGYKQLLSNGVVEKSKAYLRDNPIKNVVTDEEPSGNLGSCQSSPTATLRQWQRDMLASKLRTEVKLALIGLSLFANWKTGDHIWPSHGTLAAVVGLTAKQVRTALAEAQQAGWQESTPRLLSGRGQTSNHYTLRWPDGRRLGPPAPSVHDQGRAPAPSVHGQGNRSSGPPAPSVPD